MKTKVITIRLYEIGDRFKLGSGIYVLAHLGDYRTTLINISTGYMWDDPITVKDYTDITEDELIEMVDNESAYDRMEYLGYRIE